MLDLVGLEFVGMVGARALDQAYRALKAECPVIVSWPGTLCAKRSGSAAS